MQAAGDGVGRARAPWASLFLSVVSPAIGFQVAGHFTYLLRALNVPFQRVKQVRLYYLLLLVSEDTQCHFCHIPLFETVKRPTQVQVR